MTTFLSYFTFAVYSTDAQPCAEGKKCAHLEQKAAHALRGQFLILFSPSREGQGPNVHNNRPRRVQLTQLALQRFETPAADNRNSQAPKQPKVRTTCWHTTRCTFVAACLLAAPVRERLHRLTED